MRTSNHEQGSVVYWSGTGNTEAMTKTTKAILAACGIGAAGYAVYRSRKPKSIPLVYTECEAIR